MLALTAVCMIDLAAVRCRFEFTVYGLDLAAVTCRFGFRVQGLDLAAARCRLSRFRVQILLPLGAVKCRPLGLKISGSGSRRCKIQTPDWGRIFGL